MKRVYVETAFLLSATVFVAYSGDKLPQCYTLAGLNCLVILLIMERNCSFHNKKITKKLN
jgi:hypothetical protein